MGGMSHELQMPAPERLVVTLLFCLLPPQWARLCVPVPGCDTQVRPEDTGTQRGRKEPRSLRLDLPPPPPPPHLLGLSWFHLPWPSDLPDFRPWQSPKRVGGPPDQHLTAYPESLQLGLPTEHGILGCAGRLATRAWVLEMPRRDLGNLLSAGPPYATQHASRTCKGRGHEASLSGDEGRFGV